MQGIIDNLTIYLIPPILFLITGISLGIFSLISGKRQFQNLLFALLCFWYTIPAPVFILHHILKGNIELILTVERITHFLYIYGPAILVLFSHSLVNKKNRIIEIGAFFISFAITLFVFTDYYIYGLSEFRWGYIVKGGIVLQLFVLWGLSTMVYSFVLTIKKLRTDIDKYTRLKLKYIMFGSLTIGLLSLGYLPAMIGFDFYPPANFAFIPLLIMAWGIYRYDVIRINLYTRRRIAGIIVKIFAVSGLLMVIPVLLWSLDPYSIHYIICKTVPYGLPPLISFICCIFLTFLSLRIGDMGNDSIVFSLLMFFFALLSIDIYINCIVTLPDVGLRVSRFSHLFVVFIPALGMHLIRIVTNRHSERFLLFLIYFIGFILSFFSQSPYYLQGMHVYSWGLFAKKAVLFDIMSFVSAFILAYNIIILSSAYRKSNNLYYRHRFLFLLSGFTIAALISMGNIPAMHGYDIYPIGNFIFIPSVFFAIALFKNNISEMIRFAGKFIYFFVMAAVVFTFYCILSAKYSDSYLRLYFITSILIILVFNFFLRQLHDTITGRQFNKLKIAFANLSDRLSRVRSIDEVSECISQSCFNDLGCLKCAVLIYEKLPDQYTGSLIINVKIGSMVYRNESDDPLSIIVPSDNPILEYIRIKHSPVKQDEVEYWILNNEIKIAVNDPLRKSMIIVPVYFENQISALLLLGVKADGALYTDSEMEFLYQLGINLGPHIENAAILQSLEETLEERTNNLRESEVKYRHFIENANEIIYKSDWRGNFIYSNPAFQKVFEYTNEEIATLNYLDFIPPENREIEFEFYKGQLKNKIDDTVHELPVITKSGKRLWIEQNVKSVKDESGRIIEFDTIVHDITERKAAEAALRLSEQKYQSILDAGIIGYFELNLRGDFTFCNNSFQNFIGYTMDELIGMNFTKCVHSEDSPRLMDQARNVYLGKTSLGIITIRTVINDGDIKYGELYISTRENLEGEVVGFNCVGIDVTERKKAEEALHTSEILYQQLMENVSDCVFIINPDGHFKYFNPALTRLSGILQDEIIGKHFLHIVHPEYRDQLSEFYLKQVTENIEITYTEFPVLLKNQDLLWIGQTVRMIKNRENEIEFYGISRDISHLKKAEDDRRILEESKTRFFANISHEIRTPLTLMLGPIESVLQGDYGIQVDTQFFKNLHRNTVSLLRLVNNLLDFSKIEAGKMTLNVHEVDIIPFARHYYNNFLLAAKSRNITLDLSSSSDSIMLFFDPEKMDKVFMNLLSNSLKFTGNGGKISISFIEDEDQCRIIISDTGEGIPGESLSNIFDRFSQADATSTRKYEGTGIGLALVKELIELHNGSITVESRYIENHPDDHGSIFTLSLLKDFEHFKNNVNVNFDEKSNLDDSVRDYRMIGIREIEAFKLSGSAADHLTSENETLPDGDKKTILVVDDNEDMRNFMKILLQKKYNLLFAENGEKGISTARYRKPDLIVTDVMMPVMNGFDMTSTIKNDENLKTTPVIMLTADTDLMNKVAGLEYGADDYLHKPFNSIELITRISSLLKNYEYQQIISRRNDEIENELEVARLLQERLLPSSMPEISGYLEHAIYIPMDKIGGDFYDIEKRDGFLNLFIADVSGHGLPGAFLASITKIALENIKNRANANKVLYLLNNVILRYTVKSNFVTAFFAMIDIRTNIMRYACAGHTHPILYRNKNDEFIELTTKGKVLGLFNDILIEEKEIQLETGDRIIFYTDGITECNNSLSGMYGEKRFMEIIKKYALSTPKVFSEELMKELESYNGSTTFEDDITMVVVDIL